MMIALAVPSASAADDESFNASMAQGASEPNGLISLTDLNPSVLSGLLRYPKYYGDPHLNRDTIDGPLLGRQYLLGSLNGFRDDLAADGIFFDFGITQVYQSVVSGDSKRKNNYVGSADAWLALDTGRMGLWSGGLIFSHFEWNWNEAISGTGALLPINADEIMPGSPSSLALSELYLMQPFSEKFQLIVGKFNAATFADTTYFANNERTQFLNQGLVNNPILGSFVPYTPLGTIANYQVTDELSIAGIVLQNAGSATRTGFDELDADKTTYAIASAYNTKFGDLPGSYQVLLGYTTKDQADFSIDERYLLEIIEGVSPVKTKDQSYAAIVTASQYLWTHGDNETSRRDGKPLGGGLFFRFGAQPENRSVIDQFYSIGLGGYGGFGGRVNDNWGVGWSGTHISGDLRSLAGGIGQDLQDFENAVETFYNMELTPSMSLTFDAQYITPVVSDRDDLIVLGTRLQIDF